MNQTAKVSLETVDPRGRIDVALFRMLDTIMRRRHPQEWAEIRGAFSDLIRDLFQEPNPKRRRRKKRC